MLFRCVMVLLVAFFAVRTYEETAIAVARTTGKLHTVQATVAEIRHISHEHCSGTGQATDCGEKVTSFGEDVIVRGQGATRTVSVDDDGPSLSEGQQVRLGLWHDEVVEIDGYAAHSAWTGDGFFFVAPLLLYPVAMGYVIAVATAMLARVLNRGGRARFDVGERLAADSYGVLIGLAVCLFLVLLTAVRDVGSPPWWPIAPVGAGTAVAALALLRGARAAAEPDTAAT
ncbi:hypothetical protein ACFYO5_22635 [Streptomyces sp. NPDC006259]|uniref:hypothetical protein n=1 Tax=Streptomyces sp. NPDC006259 TaxID=3364740 RepID=UPI003685CCFD